MCVCLCDCVGGVFVQRIVSGGVCSRVCIGGVLVQGFVSGGVRSGDCVRIVFPGDCVHGRLFTGLCPACLSKGLCILHVLYRSYMLFYLCKLKDICVYKHIIDFIVCSTRSTMVTVHCDTPGSHQLMCV